MGTGRESILVTGALGEMGHELLTQLLRYPPERLRSVVALDLREPSEPLSENINYRSGDILNEELLSGLFEEFNFTTVFHFAALLSSTAAKDPFRAHQVNIDGSLNLLQLAQKYSETAPVKFLFPSSIAAYGMENEKCSAGKVRENQYLEPITVYGSNKLYIEGFGRLMSSPQFGCSRIDFRCIRFPGLLSSETLPTGGTSDYASEMVHAAAKNESYSCFVRENTALPFMTMPDAVRALQELWNAPEENLTRRSYNIGAFSITAQEIEAEVRKYFPDVAIHYEPVEARNAMVDSWPADVDDSAAQNDWGWKAEFGRETTFRDYLIPGVQKRYA